MGVDAVALGQGNGLEVHHEELGLGIRQLQSQVGEERDGIPQHSVEAGVVRSSGEEVAIGLGDQTVTPVKVEAEENDHQSDSEKLAIGGLLLGLVGQA